MTRISQINIKYEPAEDRLLLRMTSTGPEGLAEYRLWLTRRFVRLMWGALDKALARDVETDPRVRPESRQALRQFQEEAALSDADFKTPYAGEQAAREPLGPAPILVTRLQIKDAGEGRHSFTFAGEQGRGIAITLAAAMVHSVRKLLADTARGAQWDLGLDLYAKSVPADAPGAPPRTLN
jgi:hypothetical protein